MVCWLQVFGLTGDCPFRPLWFSTVDAVAGGEVKSWCWAPTPVLSRINNGMQWSVVALRCIFPRSLAHPRLLLMIHQKKIELIWAGFITFYNFAPPARLE